MNAKHASERRTCPTFPHFVVFSPTNIPHSLTPVNRFLPHSSVFLRYDGCDLVPNVSSASSSHASWLLHLSRFAHSAAIPRLLLLGASTARVQAKPRPRRFPPPSRQPFHNFASLRRVRTGRRSRSKRGTSIAHIASSRAGGQPALEIRFGQRRCWRQPDPRRARSPGGGRCGARGRGRPTGAGQRLKGFWTTGRPAGRSSGGQARSEGGKAKSTGSCSETVILS